MMYEWDCIKRFAQSEDFGGEHNFSPNADQMLAREQLRCLWTAYCILYDLEPDTRGYDQRIAELWDAVISNRELVGSRDEFDDETCFDLWMGAMLC